MLQATELFSEREILAAEHVGAEAELGDKQAGAAEFAVAHKDSSWRSGDLACGLDRGLSGKEYFESQ
ncbi:MAG TPA: hypothetical protein VFM32_03565, partial [Spongiibacteraceae bacterium]|nr:hypothetical protein [Spongiibacteraceae bacterium]